MGLWEQIQIGIAKFMLKRLSIPKAMQLIASKERAWRLQDWRYQAEKEIGLVEKVAWVYACVRVIAENCAKVDLSIKKIVKENLYEDIFNHPLEQVLDVPNPFMDRFGLLEATFGSLKASGRAFWYLPVNALGEVAQIWPLLSSNVSIVPDRKNFVKAYVYNLGGEKIPFRPREILMFKCWAPTSIYEGMGALRASQHAVDQDVQAQRYGTAFFKNAAIPAGFLVTDQFLTPKQLDQIEDRFQKEYGGVDKAHAMAVLHGGLKYQQLMIDPERALLIANRTFSAKEILTAFGVPPTEVGMVVDVGRGTAEALHVVFLENVVEPLLTRVASTITRGVLRNKYYQNTIPSGRLIAKFGDVIPVHTETRSRAAERNARAAMTLVRALGAEEGLEEAKRQGLISQHATMGTPLIFGGQEGLMPGKREESNVTKEDAVARGGAALKGLEFENADELSRVVAELRALVDALE